jgi:hypothetical protein
MFGAFALDISNYGMFEALCFEYSMTKDVYLSRVDIFG